MASEAHDVRSASLTFYDGYCVGAHRHDWAQLIYARSGMMRVLTGGQTWLVPPTRAIWIPATTEHAFVCRGEVAFRTLYVAEARSRQVQRGTGTFEVSPLLGELILHILGHGMLDPQLPAHDRIAGILVDLINAAPPIDLMLPLPTDARARRLAEHFQTHPDDCTGLPQLAAAAGASVRTLQRRFVADTGITVDVWRKKARLIASTAALSSGSSVTAAALDCGYSGTSAFIAAFKQQFAMTPGQFARMR